MLRVPGGRPAGSVHRPSTGRSASRAVDPRRRPPSGALGVPPAIGIFLVAVPGWTSAGARVPNLVRDRGNGDAAVVPRRGRRSTCGHGPGHRRAGTGTGPHQGLRACPRRAVPLPGHPRREDLAGPHCRPARPARPVCLWRSPARLTEVGAALRTSIAATVCRHPPSHQPARTGGLSPVARNRGSLDRPRPARRGYTGPADSTGTATYIRAGAARLCCAACAT